MFHKNQLEPSIICNLKSFGFVFCSQSILQNVLCKNHIHYLSASAQQSRLSFFEGENKNIIQERITFLKPNSNRLKLSWGGRPRTPPQNICSISFDSYRGARKLCDLEVQAMRLSFLRHMWSGGISG